MKIQDVVNIIETYNKYQIDLYALSEKLTVRPIMLPDGTIPEWAQPTPEQIEDQKRLAAEAQIEYNKLSQQYSDWLQKQI